MVINMARNRAIAWKHTNGKTAHAFQSQKTNHRSKKNLEIVPTIKKQYDCLNWQEMSINCKLFLDRTPQRLLCFSFLTQLCSHDRRTNTTAPNAQGIWMQEIQLWDSLKSQKHSHKWYLKWKLTLDYSIRLRLATAIFCDPTYATFVSVIKSKALGDLAKVGHYSC